MGWRILVNFIRQPMLKLPKNSGFHDLFLNYINIKTSVLVSAAPVNGIKIPHCRNNSKIPHSWNISKIKYQNRRKRQNRHLQQTPTFLAWYS
jgi:hypothetical protein